MSTGCSKCQRRFGSAYALQMHVDGTHNNPNWVASQKTTRHRADRDPPTCPKCGGRATVFPAKYGMKAECCGLWSWNYKPLVDGLTHRARIKAHDAFDTLWKSGRMSRGEAYRRLQKATGLPEPQCHMAVMSREQAEQVVSLIDQGVLYAV